MPAFQTFARACGFSIDPCRARTGSDKGRVGGHTDRSAFADLLLQDWATLACLPRGPRSPRDRIACAATLPDDRHDGDEGGGRRAAAARRGIALGVPNQEGIAIRGRYGRRAHILRLVLRTPARWVVACSLSTRPRIRRTHRQRRQA